jgi:FRG domain-containing protein
MKPITIESWEHLFAESYDGSYNPHIKRHRSPYAFRGLSADYPLITTLERLGHPAEKVPMIERSLFRNFKKYAYMDVPPGTSEWKWLTIAQHHGLPTRLLDWTYSPFVAAHFATSHLERMDQDGVIWCLNYYAAQEFLPNPLRELLRIASSSVFTAEMLEDEYPLIQNVEQLKGTRDAFVFFFEPPALDPRIVNQVGLFSFMNRPLARLDAWLDDAANALPHLAKKLVIPAKLKWEIRDKLDQANITERVLFPGLDGLSTWLRRWYTPAKVASHPSPKQKKGLRRRKPVGREGE